MTQTVQIEVDAHVAHVQLCRPERLNALNPAMLDSIVEAGETLRANGEVRAIVISGAGDAFCAGMDKSCFADMLGGPGGSGQPFPPLLPRTHGIANVFQQVALTWRQQPAPVIAAIHGACYGGGFQIALGADMRYARADARLSIREIAWGLIPDMAGTQLIQGLARDDLIRELTYTGREFSGSEGADFGLVTRVCEDPLEAALTAAREIATKNPTAIEAAKRVLNAAPSTELAAGLQHESDEQAAVLDHQNFREALASAMERRRPQFKNAR